MVQREGVMGRPTPVQAAGGAMSIEDLKAQISPSENPHAFDYQCVQAILNSTSDNILLL